MKKIGKIVLMFMCVLLLAGTKTTKIQAAGSDKATAELITHDKLYELSCEKNTEYWYTFNAVDYTNYYTITVAQEGQNTKFYIYDEEGLQVYKSELSNKSDKTGNVKLTPEAKYYIKVINSSDTSNRACTFKLVPNKDEADTKEDAEEISIETLYEYTICVNNDEDWFKLTTNEYYQKYELTGNHSSEDSYFAIFNITDEENNLMMLKNVSSNVKETLTLEPNTTYYLKVTAGKQANYSFKFTPAEKITGWYTKGKSYWYEDGLRQGTYDDPKGVLGDGTVRGREIYDPDSDGWYWLDSCYDGAKAVSKEVWMPYIYQNEATWDEEEILRNAEASGNMAAQVAEAIRNGYGKWVRYDENGKMYKGWYTNSNGVYYYDPKTGLMAKGSLTIDDISYYFDPITGILQTEK